jgi:osmotically inducible protein OsmC
MKRNASAVWNGGIRDGKGTISTDSGALQQTQYSFGTRFEQGVGTNPEELIAAAHAGCFSMALSLQLGEAGFTVQSIQTKAAVDMSKGANGFAINSVHLDVAVQATGADQAAFEKAAEAAKTGCLVSRILNIPVTMSARLGA